MQHYNKNLDIDTKLLPFWNTEWML